MGGNALEKGSIRIDKNLFEKAVNHLTKISSDCLWDVYSEVVPIPSYRNKSDFGDIDILCLKAQEYSGNRLKEVLETSFGATEYVRNGNVLSFDLRCLEEEGIPEDQPAIQVDLMEFSDHTEFWFAYHYFSYNDLGNLLGRIAHNMGFKLGHNGLTYKFMHGTYMHRELTLASNWYNAIGFLGYDADTYLKGFDDLEDIFEFVASSPYFHPDIFLLENRDGESRRRDSKRKTYNAFLKWCEENRDRLTRYEYSKDKDTYLVSAFNQFKAFESQYHTCVYEVFIKQQLKKEFNGERVMAVTDFTGKKLGDFMKAVKQSFPSVALFEEALLYTPDIIWSKVFAMKDGFNENWSG